ncbi:tetratricopeptide repeat protein [Ktedonosporobacter rubrisoli]|uniref:Tetratricopeptide repeat protein n=1 Tax=Ktedonosporobacter rubrisoli TaxID=2509675 RepID=A0A4P6K1S6_KTERU|nr:NB-ARC domain-containing protein [Ktedonosporobacter rubrisoli]QBD82059.1 tetratricopeptide repeat protein [Ktedonosporobacter rubrisoli]
MRESNDHKKQATPNYRLKAERERRGWTHKDVAERIGVPDPHTVGRWERGANVPRNIYQQALQELFGKSAEDLGLDKTSSSGNELTTEPTEQPVWELPHSFTPFIGREQDVAELCALLRRKDIRLVTLLGPGGIGKTRLSVQVANEVRSYFTDGSCFVSLSSITDAALVLPSIAQHLGIHENGSQRILERLKQLLKNKHLLLILDNFEQVVEAAPAIEDLLGQCPHLKVLVTSRAVLHLYVEQQFSIKPLTLPDLQHLPPVEELERYESIALFVQRIKAVFSNFKIGANDVGPIAEICVHLDGLPLAIELAAARIKLLPLPSLLARLRKQLDILKSDLRTLPDRQQTLYNTMKWSYDLLNQQEQWLFRHLAVFAGSFTLEAIEAFFSTTAPDIDILNTTAALLDNSLLQHVEQDGNAKLRYTMLETIREYGLYCLQRMGELTQSQHAYALHYLDLLEKAEPHLKGEQQVVWLETLEQEKENLRAALGWLIEHKEVEFALRFMEIFGKFCGLSGYWSEEQHWLTGVLELSSHSPASIMRARVLRRAGHLAYRLRDLPRAHLLLEESATLSQTLEDLQNLAGALSDLAWVYYRQKVPGKAEELLQESVEAAKKSEDKWALANALESYGRLMYNQGNTLEAQRLLQESVTLARQLPDKEARARILTTFVSIEIASCNIDFAEKLAQESFKLAQQLELKPILALALDSLGNVALFQGSYEKAKALFTRRLYLAREFNDTSTMITKQLNLADVAFAQGSLTQASEIVKQSLPSLREQGDNPNIALALLLQGALHHVQGEIQSAYQAYLEVLQLSITIGNTRALCGSLVGIARTAIETAQYRQAMLLLGFAEAQLLPCAYMHPAQYKAYTQMVENIRAQIGNEAFTATRAEGRTKMHADILTLAKSIKLSAHPSSLQAPSDQPLSETYQP